MTQFEKELRFLSNVITQHQEQTWKELMEAFIAKYDPAKQPQSNVTRIAGAMDAQTVEQGLAYIWGTSTQEKPIKTTQFDTLTNPTHIVHPLGFEFTVKDAVKTMPSDYIWEINGKTIARYHAFDGGRLIFKNPFSSEYLRGFDIEKLILDLPK